MIHQGKPLPVQVIILFGFFAIIYMLILITSSIYKDYRVKQYLMRIQDENVRLTEEIQTKEEQLRYFSSPQFKDKYAKQNMGKVNPGEKVIVFSEVEENIFFQSPEESSFRRDITNLPNAEQWYEYFFGDPSELLRYQLES